MNCARLRPIRSDAGAVTLHVETNQGVRDAIASQGSVPLLGFSVAFFNSYSPCLFFFSLSHCFLRHHELSGLCVPGSALSLASL